MDIGMAVEYFVFKLLLIQLLVLTTIEYSNNISILLCSYLQLIHKNYENMRGTVDETTFSSGVTI